METLTREEFDTLIEALEAWEVKDMSANMVDDVLTMAIGSRMTEEMKLERDRKRTERDFQKRVRKEKSVLLRAKLIKMRDAHKPEEP